MNAAPEATAWTGPFGGLPPLDTTDAAALEATFLAALQARRAAFRAVGAHPDAPTFEDTIAPLEASSVAFHEATVPLWVHLSTGSTPALREVERRIMPLLAALDDEMVQDEALFARIDAVAADPGALDDEQRRLVTRLHHDFRHAGAGLAPDRKARLAALNQELASLYTAFSQAVLADEQRFLTLQDEAELAGLPASFRAAAAAAAAERGLENAWILVNTRSAVELFLTLSERRDLRERVWRAFVQRGDNGDEHDTNGTIARILAARRERANLLGFATHAHWATSDQMAKSPNAARGLLTRVAGPAITQANAELAALAEVAGHPIAPWDVRFYQEAVRRTRYDLDDAEVKPYFQLHNLRDALFFVAGRLYGLTFERVDEAPLPHGDVQVFEVRGADGAHVGLWYFDPFARPGKRSGAWMMSYRLQCEAPTPRSAVVVNVCNFVKGAGDAPTLLSWSDARTLFHEFGHALHGLLSRVTWPSLSGTSVARDFVEFPSQLHEHFLRSPDLLRRFATHAETGAPIPDAMIARLEESRAFGQGIATAEYVASALIDLDLHLAAAPVTDIAAFERALLADLGQPEAIPPRHRPTHFLHIFAGDGYAAMYYAYLWADLLVADAAEAFVEAGDWFDADTGRRLHDTILSIGGTVDEATAFRAFRGRDPDDQALLRDRGFAPEADA